MDTVLLPRDSYRPRYPLLPPFARYRPFPFHLLSRHFRPRPRPRPPFPYHLNPWTSRLLPSSIRPRYGSLYPSSLDRLTLLHRSRLNALGPPPPDPTFPRSYATSASFIPPHLRREEAGRFNSSMQALHSLRPRGMPFKQTRGEKMSKKSVQGRKRAVDFGPKRSRVTVNIEALAAEVRELHALWRTGVDQTSSKQSWNTVVKRQSFEAPRIEQGNAAKSDEKPDREEPKRAGWWSNIKQQKRTLGITQADGKSSESLANAEATTNIREWPVLGQSWRDGADGSGWGGSVEKVKVKVEVPEMTESEVQEENFVVLQRRACERVREFLGEFSEGEESEDEFVSDEETDADQKSGTQSVKGREDKAFEFFSRLLLENQELRKLYVERCNNGKFECLVCSAIGGKMIKRFTDLVSLVMHASKILKTKRRPEHRGYGRAVCGVLGWDPLRTPALPKAINIRPRGCIPPADVPDMAVVQNNVRLECVSFDGAQAEKSTTHKMLV